MKKVENKNYESVIPTATTTLYPLMFTDIPFARETFEFLQSKQKVEYLPDKILAVELEARHKLIDKLLIKENITQVLELASGFSSRGIEFCKNEKAKYIEIDLPQVITLRKECFKNFLPENLKILNGNALNNYNFCEKYFAKNQKVAIIHQGLLRYLTFEEKAIIAENVKNILQKFGGVWITCDFTPAKFIQSQNQNLKGLNEGLSALTDRNNLPRFKNLEHVKEWLGERGFYVEVHEFAEAEPLLTSPQILNITKQKTKKLLEHAIVCVIRLK
ncbi:MAG: class I SAM-dependent methyltransferase [Christensenellaceae bacterium]|jgi:O-methyltransferase involved in polyketide biosynthesis|nr:class I SAM-dependent methyltransferase [Christensenellaceae bacterium]